MPKTTANQNRDNIEVIVTKIDYVQRDVADIKRKLDADYVTQDQFMPIARLVYGMVTAVLLAVVGGMLALVIK